MANAVARSPLSGSTQYKPIKVAATATLGTNIHTTDVSSSLINHITLYGFNSDTVDRILTIEWGGASVPDQNLVLTIPPRVGLILLVPEMPLVGTGAVALSVTAFCAAAANVITIWGFVDKVTP